jgi:hypothetical protein
VGARPIQDDEMADEDLYGDTDPNNVPDDGAEQDASAGDGLPGYPVDAYPGWRAGAFGSGDGLLGMTQVTDSSGAPSAAAPQAGAVDWDFIHQKEAAGAPKLSMSVPQDGQHHVLGHSGPTIGYGFDVASARRAIWGGSD